MFTGNVHWHVPCDAFGQGLGDLVSVNIAAADLGNVFAFSAQDIANLVVAHRRATTHVFNETGARALNLVALRQEDRATRASVKMEIGGEFMQGVTAIRPYARIGFGRCLRRPSET